MCVCQLTVRNKSGKVQIVLVSWYCRKWVQKPFHKFSIDMSGYIDICNTRAGWLIEFQFRLPPPSAFSHAGAYCQCVFGKKRVEEYGRRRQKCSLWLGRKVKRILVLKHFGFKESDSEQTKIMCKMCHATVSAPQGNKTNLFNHLKSTHSVIHDQVVKEQKTQKWEAPWLLPPPHSPQLRTHFTMRQHINTAPTSIKK